MGGTQAHRLLKVRAHPHGKSSKPIAGREFCKQCEMRRRVVSKRRNAHQAFEGEPICLAALFNKSVHFIRQHSCLLFFFTGVDLNSVREVAFLFDRPNQAGFVNATGAIAVDDVEFSR